MSAALPLHWHRTTLDGQVAVYGDAGEGSPLVFVHGWGLHSRTYARALPHLASRGVRVLAPALPGFGSSDPLPGDYTWRALAAWMDELLEHAGIDEPADFVGHSFGGGVSVATAWYHPDRVRSIVLVNSIGGSVWKERGTGDRHLHERPLWDWGLRLPREWTRRSYRRVLPVVVRDLVGNALRNPQAVWRAADLARSADLRDELEALAARGLPITVLWGDQDRVVPRATFLATCAAAGAAGDIVEGGAHSWLLADPAGFGEVVTNSLAVHRMAVEAGERTGGGSAA